MCKTLTGECCVAGPQGVQGPQGIQGVQGPQGIQGNAAIVTAGTTTTLAPGSSALVTNVGTQFNAIFNFDIPQGATGATGATGNTGPQGVAGASPIRQTFWQDESIPTVGSAFTSSVVTTVPYAWRVYQTSAAQNDSFHQNFVMAAGSYNLYAVGQQDTNKGITSWYINGVLQGTMDWYRASTLNTIMSIPVTLPAASPLTITATILSKNGSSSGYQIIITKFAIY